MDTTNISSLILDILSNKDKDNLLQEHQSIVKRYFIKSDIRGLLVFHNMGTGKTRILASIIDHFSKTDPTRNIFIIAPKSLHPNAENAIKKFSNNIKYNLVSLNASNMYDQVRNKSKKEVEFEDTMNIMTKNNLEHSLIIIDEYHNLSNSIANGSSNAIKLYKQLMKTRDTKLIFATGTPIINSPFELAATFNMLHGKKIFPTVFSEFSNYFINNNKIKNKEKFQNRIMGYVSYYNKIDEDNFPVKLSLRIEYVEMSSDQYAIYLNARDDEKREESVKFKRPSAETEFKNKGDSKSSYRIKSRQISNFAIPSYALTSEGKKIVKHIDKIKDDVFLNLNQYSPKFMKIIDNIKKHKNELGVVYSEFVSFEGLALFAKTLQHYGYSEYNDDLIMGKDNTKKYALFTGKITSEERAEIVKVFTSEKNKNGDVISLLLISKTGAEGLNLKNVRHIHIMEPFWNWARIEQIITRAVRYKSHENLPEHERDVQPYIYISKAPRSEKKYEEKTTDEILLTSSLHNKELIDNFTNAIIEASIDCSEYNENCRICQSDNNKLFTDNLYADINNPDPCHVLNKTVIDVNEIIVNGEKYYYNKDDIFSFNERFNAYVPMEKNDMYADIRRKLINV